MFAVENATTRPLRRTWTPKEDQILRREVQAQCNPPLFYSFSDPTPALLSGIYVLTKTVIRGEVNDWCRIATKLPGRSNKDCRKRWFNSVAGGLKKGTWTKSEDDLLRRGVEDYGHRWTLVAEVVRSRSADQCAKRWQQSLDPDLDHSEWTESEDTILADAVRKWGRHWRDIQARHFPARSKNDIKNRYTILLRRSQNGSASSAPGTPGLKLPGGENYSIYGEDDSDTQSSYTGSHGFGTPTNLSNHPSPLFPSQQQWLDPYPEWTGQNALAPQFGSNALLSPSIPSLGYGNWDNSYLTITSAAMNNSPSFTDFELLPPSATSQADYFQSTPPLHATSYAMTPPFAPTSAPSHHPALSRYYNHSSPASPYLTGAASGSTWKMDGPFGTI